MWLEPDRVPWSESAATDECHLFCSLALRSGERVALRRVRGVVIPTNEGTENHE